VRLALGKKKARQRELAGLVPSAFGCGHGASLMGRQRQRVNFSG